MTWFYDDKAIGKESVFLLSRSMSPAMVADYTLHLPDKEMLENKLRELTDLAYEDEEDS